MELPIPFTERMQQLLGQEYPLFEASLTTTAPNTIRLNPHKNATTHPQATPVAWCPLGSYQEQRHSYTYDPLFHAGTYYVQEAASMFLYQAIAQQIKSPVRYLDLCAAPGGKTTLALSALPQGSLVVCNEYVKNRANILRENIIKWGHPNTIVTNNAPAHYTPLTHFFDVVATDVPCSGEGMFRKDPTAIEQWNENNVTLCSQRQKEILADIWETLKPGGLLIYSTCTYNTDENEAMVQHLVDTYQATPIPLNIEPHWNITPQLIGTKPCYRFMPHKTQGEGLFMAILQKPNNTPIQTPKPNKNKNKKQNTPQPIPQECKTWIKNPDLYHLTTLQNTIHAIPKAHLADFELLNTHLNIIHAGIPVAETKGKTPIPQHALALSTQLNRKTFHNQEIDYNTTIAYLKREAIQLPPDTPNGITLLTFKNQPIGWVKNLGNRANNLYPQEWRIRSNYPPEQHNSPITIQ